MYVMFTASAMACLYGLINQMRFDADFRPINLAMKVFVVGFIAFGAGRFLLVPHFATAQEQMIARLVHGGGLITKPSASPLR
jgi:hypothetical protein